MTTASTPRTGISEVTLPEHTFVGRRHRVALNELAGYFAETIPAVAAMLAREQITPVGPPVAAYRQERDATFEVTVGFPVSRRPESADLVLMCLPAGRAIETVHVGAYQTLREAYARLTEWCAVHQLQPPGLMWEEYLVGPEAGENGCVTRVVFPLS